MCFALCPAGGNLRGRQRREDCFCDETYLLAAQRRTYPHSCLVAACRISADWSTERKRFHSPCRPTSLRIHGRVITPPAYVLVYSWLILDSTATATLYDWHLPPTPMVCVHEYSTDSRWSFSLRDPQAKPRVCR